MSNIFLKLDKEKQNRIINASLAVFSKKEFKHASTDDIASIAQISKGSLFQYFKNKRALYMFIYNYAMKTLNEKVDEQFDYNERDYFEILKKSMYFKLKLLEEYPYIYRFIIRANEETDPQLAEAIATFNSLKESSMLEKIYGNVDYSKFTEDTDFVKLNKMINWCAEGIRNEGLKDKKDYLDMQDEVIELINFFKKAVYKEEYI